MEPALIVYSTTTLSTHLLSATLHRSLTLAHVPCHPPIRVSSLPASALPLLSPHQPIIFILSTTGAGEPNTDLKTLWQLLMRDGLPPDLLENVCFAVLGCGDSGYERFNWVGKIWRRRMLALGGVELDEREQEEGWWADERSSGGLEETSQPFTESLIKTLLPLYYLPSSTPLPPLPSTTVLPSLYTTSHPKSTTLSPTLDSLTLSHDPTSSTTFRARLSGFKRMTAPDWTQDVRQLTFDLPAGQGGAWQPGAIAHIKPRNATSSVDQFFDLQPHLKADEVVQFEQRKEVWEPQHKSASGRTSTEDVEEDEEDEEDFYTHNPPPLPSFANSAITPRELIRNHVDLSAVPTRAFFQWLRLFTNDEREIERLDEFLHPMDGPDDVYTYATKPRRSILETLSDFRSVALPLVYLPEVLPPLRPREFSIANDSGSGKLELSVAMVEYKSSLRVGRVGLCTAFFRSLRLGDEVDVRLTEGTMALPTVSDRPIVCVGPGTGIAPLRALIQRRVKQGETRNTVYFGCRKEASDFLFKDDWSSWSEKVQVDFRAAFSRDQDDKRYVQHLIEEDSADIYRKLIVEEGYFYISGSSNAMPRAVKTAVVRCFMKEHVGPSGERGVNEIEARRMVEQLEELGRWSEECWS